MHNLYKTTALVTVFTAFEHFLGFLYRIILSRTLGAEGLGVYQVALTVYSVFLTISVSGIPVTLSRTLSKHRAANMPRRGHAATSAAVLIALMFSLPITLALFLLRDPFSHIFADPRSADLFYILLFGLSFTSLYTVIRGSFWGNRRFFAYSVVELFEEISMVMIGILLILVIPSDLPNVNKAAVAVFISHFLSFLVALCYYFFKGGKFTSPKKEFLPLLKSALPVSSMRTLSSLITSLISVIFPMRLMAAGMTSKRAMSEYGVVFGMVMPVLTLPSTLIGSIALVLVPELSECYYKKEKEKLASLVEKALNITLLTAFLLIPLFFVCGQSVGIFLFSDAESGKLIAYSCLLLVPMSLTMITTSILNSIGCEKQTLLFFLLGSAAMLICVWFLPPYLGSGALILGMTLDYLVSALCSLILLRKRTSLRSGKYCLKLALISLVVAAAGYGINYLMMKVTGYVFATVVAALFIMLAEALLLWLLKMVDFKSLLKKLPFAGWMARRKKKSKAAANDK